MESAPQSTITHNAVIEFASDFSWFPTPRQSPRERRAHKKNAYPAQRAASNRAGPCQNRIPGATLRRTQTVDFSRVFVPKRAFSQGSWRILEMAIGQVRQRNLPALPVQNPWRRCIRDDSPDRGYRHAGETCVLCENLKAGLGDRT